MLAMYILTIYITNGPFIISAQIFWQEPQVKLSDLYGMQHGIHLVYIKTWKNWNKKQRVETKFMDFICM